MKPIRILHISDVHAGSGEFEKIKNELIDWSLSTSTVPAVDIDYIIICGNLVSSTASPSDYENARDIIMDLAQQVLVRDPIPSNQIINEIRLSRILIVPGQNEFSSEENRSSFIDFYRDFFKPEYDKGRIVNFYQQFMLYRDLKDFTVIGIPYFDSSDKELQKKLLKDFADLLQIKQAISEIPDYSKHSPTLLLSAGNPTFNSSEENYPRLSRIGELLDKKMSVKLHLFGGGIASGILPEIDFRHISLGTGSRQKDVFYPFRANLIEIDKSSQYKQNANFPFIKVHVYQKRNAGQKSFNTDYIKGELDLFFKKQADDFDESSIYKPMSEQIIDAILDDEVFFIPISGLPGAGKTEYFNYLKNNPKTLSRYYNSYLIDCEIESYSDSTIQSVLNKVKFASETEKDFQSDNAILAISDRCFGYADGKTKMKVKDFVRNLCAELQHEIRAILYFIPNLDYKQGYEPMPGRTKEILIEPLDLISTQTWADSYSKDVPLVKYFYDLTGGYIGFSKLTLENAKDLFSKNISGAERLSSQIDKNILNGILETKSLDEKSTAIVDSIKKILGGPEFCDCVFKQIVQNVEQGKNLEEIDEIKFTKDEIIKALGDSNNKESIAETLINQLINSRVVERDYSRFIKLKPVIAFLAYYKNKIFMEPIDKDSIPLSLPSEIDYLIITALKEERDAVIRKFNESNVKRINVDEDPRPHYYVEKSVCNLKGDQGKYKIAITSVFGMGNTQAALATSSAIRFWKPRCVVLVGIAGGFSRQEVNLGDILIADQIIDYELQKIRPNNSEPRLFGHGLDTKHINYALDLKGFGKHIQVTRPEEGEIVIHKGPIFSGNKVDAAGAIIKKFGKMYPKAIGIEMEAAGVAPAVKELGKSFFMVRSASDLADGNKDSENVQQWRDYACDVAASFTLALIEDCVLSFNS